MFITKLALPRRTFLRGVGATVALPFLDAMVPAVSGQSKSAPRFAVVYIGNGANMAQWTPTTDGIDFEMTPTLKGIEAYRDRMAVFTGLDNFPATDQGDVGGQHPRAAPVSRHRAAAALNQARPALRMALLGFDHLLENRRALLVFLRFGEQTIELDAIHLDQIILTVAGDIGLGWICV